MRRRTVSVLNYWLWLVVPLLYSSATCRGAIVLETRLFRYEISEQGRSVGAIDVRDGKNYVGDRPAPFAVLVQNGQQHEANHVARDGDRLRVAFADSQAEAVIRIEQQPQWLVFELEQMKHAENVEQVALLNLSVSIPARKVAVRASCVRSDRFTIGCQTLNLKTESRLQISGREVTLSGRGYQRFGVIGTRVGLFGAPNERILEVIEAIEIAEPAVPHPTLDGVWARVAPDSRTSYLFIDMTEQNADQIIQIAKELHFGYILIYANDWAKSLGSYEINRKMYPHGAEGLRAVVGKAHAAGLKVGIHCLTGFINKNDSLATPIPDPRLAKDGRVTLASDIDTKSTFVATVESPEDFPSDVGYGLERQGFDVQIDNEIISYRSLATAPPYGLQRCLRGAHGTHRAPHRKGAAVWHLTQRYSHYLADCDTDLTLQIARRYAEVINGCEVDMIYFDGAGSSLAFGRQWAWRNVPLIPLESAALWNREVRVGGSCFGPLYWHLQSFKTCNDFAEIAVKRFLDNDKLPSAIGVKANYVPADLGWWGFHSWAPHRRATTPDEIAYVCQKAIGFDTCWSLETTLHKIRNCGRWLDIKEIIARYEQLRLDNVFPERVKQAIRQDAAEFRLVGSDEHGWQLAPTRYGPPHLVLDKNSSVWTVANDLPEQPLRFRLYALPTLSPYAAADNPLLLGQNDLSQYVKTRTQASCTTDLRTSDEKTPDGETCVRFSAQSPLTTAAGWVEHRADLTGIGGRTGPPALIEGLPEEIQSTTQWSRPLGVWVYGDGKCEVLNIQLRSANGGYRDHYVDINFTGWKYCELTRPESDRVFAFNSGYSRKHAVRHFQYDRIAFLYLRYNAIPPKTDVCCQVGPIKALREHWLPIAAPAFAVGDQKIVFPCQLQTEQYLEFDGTGIARLYDREGVQIGRVEPEGMVPILQKGKNQVVFSSDAGPSHSQRADITIIRIGHPF